MPRVTRLPPQVQKVLLLNKADLVPPHVRRQWAEFFCKQEGMCVYFYSTTTLDAGEADCRAEEDGDGEEEEGGQGKILSSQELLDELLHLGRMAQTNATERVRVGFVGFPNVGKSSAVNSLLGAKKVAESKSAGRTKHLQTMLIGEELCLCDSPGIVFPSVISSRSPPLRRHISSPSWRMLTP